MVMGNVLLELFSMELSILPWPKYGLVHTRITVILKENKISIWLSSKLNKHKQIKVFATTFSSSVGVLDLEFDFFLF